MKALREARERGFEEVKIDFEDGETVFPNTAVPMAAAIDRFQREGGEVEFANASHYLDRAHFAAPPIVSKEELEKSVSVLNVIWSFVDDNQIHLLLRRLLSEVGTRIECREGVLLGLDWSMNEVMDNVLVHSQAPCGFVLAQIHQAAKHFAVCVADQGLGVPNTIRQAFPTLRDDRDALATAIKAGTTRDKKVGQGNGLWGLTRIVTLNDGYLSVTSGRNMLCIEGEQPPTFESAQSFDIAMSGTIVDFQLNTSRPIDVARALEMPTVINLRMEALEDDSGGHMIRVADTGLGTGTRKAGAALRTLILNVLEEGKRVVTVDFSGIGMVSSSFADEVIGKLVKQLGFVGFTQRIELAGMTDLIQQLVHRSVAQRMMEGIENGD